MNLCTDDLILRTVVDEDIDEIARMWNFFQGGVSREEAQNALAYMTENHTRNQPGSLYHLCLAVCFKGNPKQILGWCGLDGKEHPEHPEIYVLLHETARNKGYGTQCVQALLAYAFGPADLRSVHGGCDKANIASAKMMQKGGMQYYDSAENGDPLFIAYKNQH